MNKYFIKIIVATATLLSAITAAQAATSWKMHMVWVPNRVEAQYYQKFVDLVNERSDGELTIELYPGGSLGVKDVDMLRTLPKGNVIQAAGLYPGYMTRDEPEYAVTLPPGVVSDPEELLDILPVLTEIYEETYDKWGIELLGYVAHPVRDTQLICKEPVTSLEELKGKKVRVWEKAQAEAFEELGIAAQIIGQNDLYMAMRTGVVDCAVYPMHFSLTVSLQEAAPYASYLFPYVFHPLHIIVSKNAYDQLPEHLQVILKDAAKEVEEESMEAYIKGEVDKESALEWEAEGGTVLDDFSVEEQEIFAQAAATVWDTLTDEIGGVARRNYENIQKALTP